MPYCKKSCFRSQVFKGKKVDSKSQMPTTSWVLYKWPNPNLKMYCRQGGLPQPPLFRRIREYIRLQVKMFLLIQSTAPLLCTLKPNSSDICSIKNWRLPSFSFKFTFVNGSSLCVPQVPVTTHTLMNLILSLSSYYWISLANIIALRRLQHETSTSFFIYFPETYLRKFNSAKSYLQNFE